MAVRWPHRRHEGKCDEEWISSRCTYLVGTWVGFGSSHLERHTRRNPADERRESIVVGGGATKDRPDCRHVVGLDAATERVGEELLGHRAHKKLWPLEQRLSQFHHTIDLA